MHSDPGIEKQVAKTDFDTAQNVQNQRLAAANWLTVVTVGIRPETCQNTVSRFRQRCRFHFHANRSWENGLNVNSTYSSFRKRGDIVPFTKKNRPSDQPTQAALGWPRSNAWHVRHRRSKKSKIYNQTTQVVPTSSQHTLFPLNPALLPDTLLPSFQRVKKKKIDICMSTLCSG